EVAELPRVGPQIIQLVLARLESDQVPLIADQRLDPPATGLPRQRVSLHLGSFGDRGSTHARRVGDDVQQRARRENRIRLADGLHDGRGNGPKINRTIYPLACGNQSGSPQDERNMNLLEVESAAVVNRAMLAEALTMVSGHDHDRVAQHPTRLEAVQQRAD